jgi:hypothetical protein
LKDLYLLRDLKRRNRCEEFTKLRTAILAKHQSITQFAKVAGVKRHVAAKAVAVKRRRTARKEQANAFREKIVAWYRSDAVSIQLPDVKFSKKRFLACTLRDAFDRLIAEDMGVKPCTFQWFCHLRPADVQLSAKIPKRMCVCGFCENVILLGRTLIRAGLKGVETTMDRIVRAMCCPYTGRKYPHFRCVIKHCHKCGPKIYRKRIRTKTGRAFQTLQSRQTVFRQWVKVATETKKGKILKVAELRDQPAQRLDAVMKIHMEKGFDLCLHHFLSRWQGEQFRNFKQVLRRGTLLQVCDFGQNYLHLYQDEVSDAHWNHPQSTFFPCNNYVVCPNPECSKQLAVEQMIMSSDRKHDHYAVFAYLEKSLRELEDLGLQISDIYRWSDNMGTQFKSRGPFQRLSESEVPTVLSFYGEYHAKNVADGNTGRAKSSFNRAKQRREEQLRDAHELHTYAVDKLNSPQEYFDLCRQKQCVPGHYIRSFHLQNEVNRTWQSPDQCAPGTKSFHDVRNTGHPGIIEYRTVTCGGEVCHYHDGQCRCKNKEFVSEWKQTCVGPKQKLPVPNLLFPLHGPVPLVAGDHDRARLELDRLPDNWEELNLVCLKTPVMKLHKAVDISSASQAGDAVPAPPEDLGDTESDLNQSIDDDAADLGDTESDLGQSGEDDDVGDRLEVPLEIDEDANISLETVSDGVEDVEETRGAPFSLATFRAPKGPREKLRVVSRDDFCESFSDTETLEVDDRRPLFTRGKINWVEVYGRINQCLSFAALSDIADDILSAVPPVPCTESLVGELAHDLTARSLVPRDAPWGRSPVFTTGDGNCAFRAASLFLTGREGMHLELRCRTTLQLASHESEYLDAEFMSKGATTIYGQCSIPGILAQYCENYKPGTKLDSDLTKDIFRDQVMSYTRSLGSWVGAWELAGLAGALDRPVVSVYPANCSNTRADLHRTFVPITFRNDNAIVLMWTPIIPGGGQCHFVPLMKRV